MVAAVSAKEEDLRAREARLAERLAQQEGIEAALERVAGEMEGEKRRIEGARAALEKEKCVRGRGWVDGGMDGGYICDQPQTP